VGPAKLIAHRGNLKGPIPSLENSPDYVDKALESGFLVEVDVRVIGKDFYLGHDFPQYPVSPSWLETRSVNCLYHLKDAQAAKLVSSQFRHWHFFCHENDNFTVTSHQYVWLHNFSIEPDERTIIPLLSRQHVLSYLKRGMYGICTDYPAEAGILLDG
jgi:hypothetical protein